MFWCLLMSHRCSCLVPKGWKQATLTGNDWRYTAAYWPSLVAGLFEPRADASDALCDQTSRKSMYGSKPKRAETSKGKKRARSSFPTLEESLAALIAASSDCSEAEGGSDMEPPSAFPPETEAYMRAFKGMPIRDAVLEVTCRAAALTKRLCGDNCSRSSGMTYAEMADLADEAYVFVTLYVAALFGEVNSSKMHRLGYHLMPALVNNGNLTDGDTSVNEGLHKMCKRTYARTNKKGHSFTLQMVRASEALRFVLDEAEREQLSEEGPAAAREPAEPIAPRTEDEEQMPEWTGGELDMSSDGDEDSSSNEATSAGAQRNGVVRKDSGHRQRLRGMRSSIQSLVASSVGGSLLGLGAALGVSDDEVIVHRRSMAFAPTIEWGALLGKQRAHCSPSNHGAPWYDFIR